MTNQNQIQGEHLARFFPKRNLLTGSVKRYGKTGAFVYELSAGKWMNWEMFGVSVLKFQGTNQPVHQPDLSESFYSIEEAEAHISKLGDCHE